MSMIISRYGPFPISENVMIAGARNNGNGRQILGTHTSWYRPRQTMVKVLMCSSSCFNMIAAITSPLLLF